MIDKVIFNNGVENTGNWLLANPIDIKTLEPGRTFPISLDKYYAPRPHSIEKAIISLPISYESKYLPYKTFTKLYKLESKKTSDWKYIWLIN